MPTFTGSVYVSLHTADPGTTGASEVNSGTHTWYARVAVTRATGSWAAPSTNGSARRTSNSGTVTFAAPTTSVSVTHMGIWDATTTGNFLWGGALGTTRNLANGDSAPSFAIGAATIDET